MAIQIPSDRGARYLRFDGLRANLSPELRKDGVWTVPPGRQVEVNLYAYASAKARSDRAAPVWDAPFITTLGDLGLVESFGPAIFAAGPAYAAKEITRETLMAAIYERLKAEYPGAIDDDEPRAVNAGLV